MILLKILFFKHQNKVILFIIKLLNSRTCLTHKNSLVSFLASDTYATSLTLAVSETSTVAYSTAPTTSKALFPKKNLMTSSTLVPIWPILVDWIVKKNLIFTNIWQYLLEAECAATFQKKSGQFFLAMSHFELNKFIFMN